MGAAELSRLASELRGWLERAPACYAEHGREPFRDMAVRLDREIACRLTRSAVSEDGKANAGAEKRWSGGCWHKQRIKRIARANRRQGTKLNF